MQRGNLQLAYKRLKLAKYFAIKLKMSLIKLFV